jgi:ATP-dependent Clp protease ATP-binding subunit ClpA
MQRLIQEKIKRQLAEDVLFGALSKNGGTAFVTVENDDLKVTTQSPEDAKKEESIV